MINKKGAREAGWTRLNKVRGTTRMMRRRAIGKYVYEKVKHGKERRKESLRILVPT